MADYTIIADVSAYIVKTLREKMCPEPVPSPNNIEISSLVVMLKNEIEKVREQIQNIE